jgi:transcriptional regulator with XRE-family HTH domain
MTSYSPEALGWVVRDLRRKKGLTQEELGRRAGYRGGAGVSISRLENGQLEPGPERFEGISKALGVSAGRLAQAAEEVTKRTESARRDGPVSIKDRVARVQRDIDGRTRLMTEIEQAFNEACDRAKDDFLMRLVEIAARMDGAPPDLTQLVGDGIPDGDDAAAEAAQGIQFTRYGVAQALAAEVGAAAYPMFTEAVVRGMISGLRGAAATGGYRAALRVGRQAASGARSTGSTALLAGIAAAPVALATAGGLLWIEQQRNRKQQELVAKLDKAEAEIAKTQPSVDVLRALMPRAIEILHYIAVHAGHALVRWEARIGQGSLDMRSLGASEQHRYQEFVEIAAAQLAVATLDFQDLITNQGSELERAAALADEILTQSRKVITSHV